MLGFRHPINSDWDFLRAPTKQTTFATQATIQKEMCATCCRFESTSVCWIWERSFCYFTLKYKSKTHMAAKGRLDFTIFLVRLVKCGNMHHSAFTHDASSFQSLTLSWPLRIWQACPSLKKKKQNQINCTDSSPVKTTLLLKIENFIFLNSRHKRTFIFWEYVQLHLLL